MGHDFAHDRKAQAQRRIKAGRIAMRLVLDGVDVDVARTYDDHRRAVAVRAAGYTDASRETWDRALQVLATDPPRFEHTRPPLTRRPDSPPCDCRADSNGQLWEFHAESGWPCPHPWPAGTAAVRVCGRGNGKMSTAEAAGLRQIVAGVEQKLRDDTVLETRVAADAGVRTSPDSTYFPADALDPARVDDERARTRRDRGAWWDA